MQKQSPSEIHRFAELLLRWHAEENRRSLPWAQSNDPYRVWVSEIMLQQTQARTVIPYFAKFIAKFPAISELAGADVDEVLGEWAGLGYYSRARNLHKTAQIIEFELNGTFPASVSELTRLPGIGRSTAGAICALAFGLSEPILDGNAKRVYSRVFKVDEESDSARTRRLWTIAQELTPQVGCAEFTQAIMDVGATVCLPRNPSCGACPLRSICGARLAGTQSDFPVKAKNRKSTAKSFTMVIATDDEGRVLLERRPTSGIWGGLWSFPEHCGSLDGLRQWFLRDYAIQIRPDPPLPSIEHRLTHLRLTITPQPCTIVQASGTLPRKRDVRLFAVGDALEAGIPAPVGMILKALRTGQEQKP